MPVPGTNPRPGPGQPPGAPPGPPPRPPRGRPARAGRRLGATTRRRARAEPLDALPDHLAGLLGVGPAGLDWRILRKSLDTRDKRDIHFVCNAEVRVPDDEERIVQHARRHARGAKVE